MKCWALRKTPRQRTPRRPIANWAKKYHPDQSPDDPKSQERLPKPTQAYDVVGDDNKRAAYDRARSTHRQASLCRFSEGAAGDGSYGGPGGPEGGPGGAHFRVSRCRPRPGGDPFADPGDIFTEIFGQCLCRQDEGWSPAGRGALAALHPAGCRRDRLPSDVTLEEVASRPPR